jgi:hypothetical protein
MLSIWSGDGRPVNTPPRFITFNQSMRSPGESRGRQAAAFENICGLFPLPT